MIRITSMDHIVLNVRDMDRVLAFYIDVLGLKGERLTEFRQGRVPFPSVRVNADTIIDLFPLPDDAPATVGVGDLNHFCLVMDTADMGEVIAHLERHGVTIAEGPVTRWGAHGNGTSIYFDDPEHRRLELRFYDR